MQLSMSEEAIARGLWTNTAHSPDSKGKRPVGSSSRSGEVNGISYWHQRPAHHSPYRPPTGRTHFSYPQYLYQSSFEKLRDAGLTVPLALRPLPHPIPLHSAHKHCLHHQIQGHDTEHCATLHHAIQDFIDSGLVNLSGPSVTTNPRAYTFYTCSSSSSKFSVD
ncbi:hypothetical protein CK203_048351 [Vitis vinifera]|uniref:Uncharacterized protein n=1 Tax=Vitis vinifera TaxID=29760 RepID=A0A438HRE3_VITVI|nr:hypothetical protein CK203_048351 [Vitis vinifera]